MPHMLSGKLRGGDLAGEFAIQFRSTLELGADVFGEAVRDAQLIELALERLLAARPDAEWNSILYLSGPVSLEW